MSQLLKSVCEKLALILALVAAGLSVAWFWRQQPGLRILQREATSPVLSGRGHVATRWRSPEPAGAGWPKPPAQSRGGGWLYEVFTPPVIYPGAIAGSFAVTPPQLLAEPVSVSVGLELLAVRLKPYRLQLLGYYGEPDDYLAAFSSSQSPETLLARPGHRFGELGLTLKSFDVHKVTSGDGEAGPVCDVVARAVLLDEHTGAEVVLDSRSRKLTDTPLAVFKPSGPTGRPCELLEGDTFAVAGATYRVERIQLDPPEVVVTRAPPGGPGPEVQVLRPAGQLAGQASGPKPLAQNPATEVARNGPEPSSP